LIQAFTLKEHPRVNFALPPVGLHKIVLHLQLKYLPLALNYCLSIAKYGRKSGTSWTFNIHKIRVGGLYLSFEFVTLFFSRMRRVQ
jgi:hypothetical protein